MLSREIIGNKCSNFTNKDVADEITYRNSALFVILLEQILPIWLIPASCKEFGQNSILIKKQSLKGGMFSARSIPWKAKIYSKKRKMVINTDKIAN